MEEDLQLSDRDAHVNKQILGARERRFKKNVGRLSKFKPRLSEGQCAHIREIVQLFKQTMSLQDLVALQNGTLYSEAVVNLYFTILSKINLVLLKTQDFLKHSTTPSPDKETPTATEKIYFCNTSFPR